MFIPRLLVCFSLFFLSSVPARALSLSDLRTQGNPEFFLIILDNKSDQVSDSLTIRLRMRPEFEIAEAIIMSYSVLMMHSFKCVQKSSNCRIRIYPLSGERLT